MWNVRDWRLLAHPRQECKKFTTRGKNTRVRRELKPTKRTRETRKGAYPQHPKAGKVRRSEPPNQGALSHRAHLKCQLEQQTGTPPEPGGGSQLPLHHSGGGETGKISHPRTHRYTSRNHNTHAHHRQPVYEHSTLGRLNDDHMRDGVRVTPKNNHAGGR